MSTMARMFIPGRGFVDSHYKVGLEELERFLQEELEKAGMEYEREELTRSYPIIGDKVIFGDPSSCQRIPQHIRNVEPSAFDPHLLSFGPYHHGKSHLIQTERLKLDGLRRFRKRCNCNCSNRFDAIAKVVCSISMLEPLKKFYHQPDSDNWKDADEFSFLKLMLVEGCFMLELLLSDDRQWLRNDKDVETIKRDMLLLENQLPMSLLAALHAFMMQSQSAANSSQITPNHQDLKLLVGNFFTFQPGALKLDGNYVHILDMYRANLLHPQISRSDRVITFEYDVRDAQRHNSTRPMILPATRLQTAGITFERSETSSLSNVCFDLKRGVLKIPHLKVDDVTKSALFNVIAYERLNPNIGNEVTSFTVLMNDLIDVDKDVALLTSKTILEHGLGTDEAAAEFFNVLGRGAALNRSNCDLFDPVYRSIEKYCSKPWHEWWTSLVNTNFQSPWTIISLIAASLGFVLLFLQTFYQVYGYHHPSPRG